MVDALKPITWVGAAKADLANFPRGARNVAGDELYLLQIGMDPVHWKPMSQVGPGVREITISEEGAFRIIYVAHTNAGPVVLHCFQKKTQQTSKADIELARQRLKEFRARK